MLIYKVGLPTIVRLNGLTHHINRNAPSTIDAILNLLTFYKIMTVKARDAIILYV